MIRMPEVRRAFVLFAALSVLSACGWAEWPPPDDGPRTYNRPQTKQASPAAFINADAVIVGKGDTVYGLSRRHRVSARAIIQANALNAPYVLTPGQRLVLPRAREHKVEPGDYLSLIAKKRNVDMYAMARLNGLKPPYTIYPGQRLVLPDGESPPPVASAAPAPQAAAPVAKPARKSLAVKKTPAAKPKPVPPPPVQTGKGFVWPVKGRVVSSYGGKKEGLQNDGINIAAPRGAAVMAAENGVVAYAGNELRGFGNLLLLKHSGGWITAYAHNEALLVKRGDKIRKGQVIARVGSTGSVQKPQLHFELRKGKKAINPIKYLPKV